MNDKDTNVEHKISNNIQEIMKALDIEVNPDNQDTPKRVAKMLNREIFSNRNKDLTELTSQMTVFKNNRSDNLIIIKDIPFNSTCSHHWMPFSGRATIGYVPRESIIGLSKIPRVVKFFSKQPQIQEKLTDDIGEYLVNLLDPKYLIVELEAEHSCVGCRGVELDCSTNTLYESTSNNDLKREFFIRGDK